MQDLNLELSKGKKLSQEDFEEFEQKTGQKLPDDFKEFYSKINGGLPTVRFFDDKCEVNQIFHLSDPYDYSILDEISSLKERREIFPDSPNPFPDWGLPFANNGFGGLYILDTRLGIGYGKVWYFDPEFGETGREIATSFREFINALKTEEEMEDEY